MSAADDRYNCSGKGKARMRRWSTSQRRRDGEWRRLRTPGTFRYEQNLAAIDATIEKYKRQIRVTDEGRRDGETFEEFTARVRAA